MAVIIAFKKPSEMTNDIAGALSLPSSWSFSNFTEAMKVTDFWNSLGNSLLITIVTVVLAILIHSIAGYAIGRNICLLYTSYSEGSSTGEGEGISEAAGETRLKYSSMPSATAFAIVSWFEESVIYRSSFWLLINPISRIATGTVLQFVPVILSEEITPRFPRPVASQ